MVKIPYLNGFVSFLLDNSKPCDIADLQIEEVRTLLHATCLCGNKPIVLKLLEIAGKELLSPEKFIDSEGWTPLHNCCDKPELVELILAHPFVTPTLYMTKAKRTYCYNLEENAIGYAIRHNQWKTFNVYWENKAVRNAIDQEYYAMRTNIVTLDSP